MEKEYLVVKWINEIPINWSVMKTSSIEDKELLTQPIEGLMGGSFLFKWNKQSCLGKVEAFGTKAEMEVKMKAEIKSSKTKDKTNLVKKKANGKNDMKVLAKRSKIDAILSSVPRDPESNEKDEIIRKLQEELAEEKLNSEALKDELDAVTQKLDAAVRRNGTVDIGNGIILSGELLSTFRTVSPTVNIYARNLFKHLFEVHEVSGYSLMGKGCNANKTNAPQPAVDSKKRDAIIGHALSTFGLSQGSLLHKLGIKDLKKSLSALILEMTKEAKKVEDNLANNE